MAVSTHLINNCPLGVVSGNEPNPMLALLGLYTLQSVEVISMQPAQLLFLLSDLQRKADHMLPAAASSRGFFLKVRVTARHCYPGNSVTLTCSFCCDSAAMSPCLLVHHTH